MALECAIGDPSRGILIKQVEDGLEAAPGFQSAEVNRVTPPSGDAHERGCYSVTKTSPGTSVRGWPFATSLAVSPSLA